MNKSLVMAGIWISVFFPGIATLSTACSNSDDAKKQENERKAQIISTFLLSAKSDCIYCSDRQAMGGNCSCYFNIQQGTCPGNATGPDKNNSYYVSCGDLTLSGTWVTVSQDPLVLLCTKDTCPPEAYSAAFNPGG